ncbi:hypothetical protein AVEN_5857-1 [Araneus ventricosus]|uniref:Uncharacterized protein n=1 Tax=Araneus ventricosus TaxID=182803 RepID=A0A4Y2KVA4_ARAVE|nr:hypothetical protein AVEN_5857-1 [Araneus ventricosus]
MTQQNARSFKFQLNKSKYSKAKFIRKFVTGGFQVRNPIPLKIRHVLGLLHVNSYVGAPAGVVQKIPKLAWPTQEGCKDRRGLVERAAPPAEVWKAGCHPRYLTAVQN